MVGIPTSLEINTRYYETLRQKYCPTIEKEISGYEPKLNPACPTEMINFRK